jgi:uncharacterized protein YecT (DUF1311 family)
VCDDATGGSMTGWRSDLRARRKAPERDARLSKLSASWPAPQQAAFAGLRQALKAFVDARDGEVERAEAGRVRGATPAHAKAQDERLNATWTRLKATCDTDMTTVTMKDILAAQRAWLKYHDAWVRFAALHYPALPAPTWIALLTEQREKELEELLEDRSR